MRIVVQKYGGSSLSDLDKLRRVAARIVATRNQGFSVVVVVSAMGNTTDELIGLAHQVTLSPDRRELDMLISVGERISMALLAMALRDLEVPARSLTGSQSGIITDESHADAQVIEVRPARVQRVLEAGQVAIVAGFQGVSTAREVTTLGRGGSDTTAVVLAAALGAEYCEICSDVDGVWSADPRVVDDATRCPELALDEALALARGGAKVLFEDAVRYARDRGIAIRASSTFGPGAGTLLTVERAPRDRPVAVTGDAKLALFEVPVSALGQGTAWLAESGARLRRYVHPWLFADVRNVHGELSGVPDEVVSHGRVAVVTAVGTGVGECLERMAHGERALKRADVAVVRRGASGDVLWWQVPGERLDTAVRAVHGVLVDPSADHEVIEQ